TLRFVRLQLALDLAMEAEQLPTAWLVIDQMAREYEVDSLELRVLALQMAGESTNEMYTKTVVTRALGLVDQALTLDDFAAAERLLAVADAGSDRVLPKLRPEMRHQVEAERRRVQDYRQRFEAYRRAAQRLRADPDDAEANLVVGRYLCLVNGDWEE